MPCHQFGWSQHSLCHRRIASQVKIPRSSKDGRRISMPTGCCTVLIGELSKHFWRKIKNHTCILQGDFVQFNLGALKSPSSESERGTVCKLFAAMQPGQERVKRDRRRVLKPCWEFFGGAFGVHGNNGLWYNQMREKSDHFFRFWLIFSLSASRTPVEHRRSPRKIKQLHFLPRSKSSEMRS